ncbi:retrovirus-related pol polyprotein from transposon TNT 1-94 [Tanacetum coccineum]|uniref:Retrovirus-related pol polyprotein from transposon TNT 1-94 n=1 Tax=Tanacetum coccineum TaxID=301880 RepID=A0ABQ5CJQ2_9ASTR
MSRSLDEKVPEEFWTGLKPSVEHFKVFGCIGHVHIPAQLRTKLDARSHKCVFLDVSQESKAYCLYDPSSKRIVISRDMIFDEDVTWDWSKENQKAEELSIEDDEKVQGSQHENEDVEDSQNTPNTTQNSKNEAGSPDQGMSQTQTAHDVLNSPVSATTGNSQDQSVPATLPESSTRTQRPPVWMDDYYADEDPFNEDEKWVQAMNAEMTAIERNHTWELVDPPAGTKPIGVKWLYKTKLNELGKVDKYKARLVVKGYAQWEGVDYNEVFAPVAQWDTIRTLIVVDAQRSWTVYQLDVKHALLNGKLKEVVYVTQPKGFIKKGKEAKVYREDEILPWCGSKSEFRRNLIVSITVCKGGLKTVQNVRSKRCEESNLTRPDLMYVVSLLSRFMAKPKEEHMAVAKRVLRYIKGTINYGLYYGKDKSQNLRVFTDRNYARDLEDRKSTSGYICLFNGAAICWSSHKQEVVTAVMTEGGYVAAQTCDALCMAERSEEQLADLMTKPLKLSVFEFIRGKIGVQAVKQAA